MNQTIFVTGGAGYIGSHVVVELMAAGHQIFILDNLCNSKASALEHVEHIAGQVSRRSISASAQRYGGCLSNITSTQ